MEEKKILEFEINGFNYLYTAKINIDKAVKIKYISIKCKISSDSDINKRRYITAHEITKCMDGRCLNTVSGIEEFINEIVQSMKISYDKNKFIKNLIKFIKEEYLLKLLDFNRLEDIFNRSLHKNKLSHVFDHSIFIPCKPIDFDTKVEVYPYEFNNKLYLHISISYTKLAFIIKSIFEYELTNRSNGEPDYYKDAWGILIKIFNEDYVIPTIYSVQTIVNMIEYCFNENLFKNIEQIESFKSDSKEE